MTVLMKESLDKRKERYRFSQNFRSLVCSFPLSLPVLLCYRWSSLVLPLGNNNPCHLGRNNSRLLSAMRTCVPGTSVRVPVLPKPPSRPVPPFVAVSGWCTKNLQYTHPLSHASRQRKECCHAVIVIEHPKNLVFNKQQKRWWHIPMDDYFLIWDSHHVIWSCQFGKKSPRFLKDSREKTAEVMASFGKNLYTIYTITGSSCSYSKYTDSDRTAYERYLIYLAVVISHPCLGCRLAIFCFRISSRMLVIGMARSP